VAAIYQASGFEVRPAERRVLRDGEAVALGARAFDLLLALIERRDRVVGKEELLAAVWPGLAVEENNLTVQISAVRKALGAGVIATVAGRGYRFALPLDEGVAPSASPPPHNLPAERSSFIGREPQIAALRQLLASRRFVTLTGIGGAGKTRLALKVAALECPRFRDGVFFVDLAPVSDAQYVVQTAAQACGVAAGDSPTGSPRTLTDRLVTAFAPRQCLLVVDNCEHVLDACADLIDALLRRCSGIVVLATSREALALDCEQVLAVPPLALPLDQADEQQTEALRLFAERAQAAHAGFRLDAQTSQPVAEICRRLDGIPLAIEFAAARVGHLSPAEIAARLGDRFQLLGGGRRRIGRQQTLAATLDWSHDLLDEREIYTRHG
jgi:non-specific serine/threonine protein kinase